LELANFEIKRYASYMLVIKNIRVKINLVVHY